MQQRRRVDSEQTVAATTFSGGVLIGVNAAEHGPGGGREPSLVVYRFRLYVAGNSQHSRRAIQMLSYVNDVHLGGQAEVEIIDIYKQPARAWRDRIVGVPALIRDLPLPVRQLSGDLSSQVWLLRALGIDTPSAAPRTSDDDKLCDDPV